MIHCVCIRVCEHTREAECVSLIDPKAAVKLADVVLSGSSRRCWNLQNAEVRWFLPPPPWTGTTGELLGAVTSRRVVAVSFEGLF